MKDTYGHDYTEGDEDHGEKQILKLDWHQYLTCEP